MSVMSERHSQLVERTNEHGHPQTYLVDEEGGPDTVVCAQCTAYVRPNVGQGTICTDCAAEAEAWAAHEYEDGRCRPEGDV